MDYEHVFKAEILNVFSKMSKKNQFKSNKKRIELKLKFLKYWENQQRIENNILF